MKRDAVVAIFILGITAAAVTGYYFLIRRGDPSGFLDWLKSVVRQATLKATGTFSGDAVTKAADLIAGFEGFSAKAYWDVDNYSIGYGHHFTDGDGYTADSVVTEDQAYQQLIQDIARFSSCVNNVLLRPPTTNQAAAMISLAYNIGCGNFTSSTLVEKFNTGDFQGAAAQFSVWRLAGGQVSQALVNRRASEQEVFLEA